MQIQIGMIVGAIGIIPIIIGAISLSKMKKATCKSDLTGIAIANLLLCSLLGGIFMLCIPESDFAPAILVAEVPAE